MSQDNSNNRPDRLSQTPEIKAELTEKTSAKLVKDMPVVDAINLREALKSNPNRIDTVSPDGRSRFCLTDNAKVENKAAQENAYKEAGMGDPDKPIGTPNQEIETPILEKESNVRISGSAEDTGTVIDYKPQEVAKNKSFALGMDYEEQRDTRSVYEKLADFGRAAAKRAADPEGWKAYIQGELDKMLGVAEGLNIAKDSTKAGLVAGWNALTDGTVAKFLSKPNAINDPLFNAVGVALTAMEENPNTVTHALERIGTTIMNASERYSALPNREKGHVIGETMFALIGPEGMQPLNSKTAEQLGLASMQESELAQLGIRKINSEALDLHMPEVPEHLKHLEFEPISSDLVHAMEQKGRRIHLAEPGSEEWLNLEKGGCSAKVVYPFCNEIFAKQGGPRVSLIEEFLHGTQQKLGILDDPFLPNQFPEIHVKDFMLRHARMLGLKENDVILLEELKKKAIQKMASEGYRWTGK